MTTPRILSTYPSLMLTSSFLPEYLITGLYGLSSPRVMKSDRAGLSIGPCARAGCLRADMRCSVSSVCGLGSAIARSCCIMIGGILRVLWSIHSDDVLIMGNVEEVNKMRNVLSNRTESGKIRKQKTSRIQENCQT